MACAAELFADGGVTVNGLLFTREGVLQPLYEGAPAVRNEEGKFGKPQQIESVRIQGLKGQATINTQVSKVSREGSVRSDSTHVVKAGLERNPVAKELMQAPAGPVVLLQDADLEALLGEHQACGHSAHPRPNDHDVMCVGCEI